MSLLVKNVKHFMERHGLNQAELGKAVGLSQPTVQRILSGKIAEPGYMSVQKFARWAGVSMDDIVNRDIQKDGPSVPSQVLEIDSDTLASALVSWDKALKRFQVPYGLLHKLPDSLILAYAHRTQYPGDLSEREYAMFDEMVQNKLKGELDVLGRIPQKARRAGS